MDIQEAQARLDKARQDFEKALDNLGKIAIEQRVEEMKQSWYKMADVLNEVKEQDNKGTYN